MRTSIAIVGGGPAGCAAALTLRRYLPHLPVTLVARAAPSTADTPAVGETLSPGVLPLLAYLGLREDFLSLGHLPSAGTASAWGSANLIDRSYLFTGRGHGFHLDRSGFDAWLLSRVTASGVPCLSARAQRATRAGGEWQIELESGSKVHANVIIEATGRSGWLLRQQGAKRQRDDRLVADVRWFQHEQPEAHADGALVESVADGWWYSASLPGQRGVAMFMTDSDLRTQTSWEERLVAAPITNARLTAWWPTAQHVVRAANSQYSEVVAGEGWVAAGDTAAAFDPISALGIGFSLRSGMEAARVAVAALEENSAPAAAYATSVGRIYADYRARLRGIYELERRWPQSPFWGRRQHAQAASG